MSRHPQKTIHTIPADRCIQYVATENFVKPYDIRCARNAILRCTNTYQVMPLTLHTQIIGCIWIVVLVTVAIDALRRLQSQSSATHQFGVRASAHDADAGLSVQVCMCVHVLVRQRTNRCFKGGGHWCLSLYHTRTICLIKTKTRRQPIQNKERRQCG